VVSKETLVPRKDSHTPCSYVISSVGSDIHDSPINVPMLGLCVLQCHC